MNRDTKPKIPVVIITGFLGSGKTTLLNHLVKQPHMKMTAIIINEFGEIGIDHLLVETSSEEMIEINNGCICCTVRGDLQDKLGSLSMWLDAGRIPPVERVIVETTGLADPAPIMHTLMTDEHLLNRYRLGGVVTLVDAIAGSSSIGRYPEAVKQIAIADQLIFSKTDLVGSLSGRDSYGQLKERVRQINSRAVVHEITNGAVDADDLFPDETEDTEEVLADISQWMGSAEETGHLADCSDYPHTHTNAHTNAHTDAHTHEANQSGIRTFLIELDEPVDRDRFNEFMQDLALEFGENLLRMKGLLNVEDRPEQPAVVHGVQHVFFPIRWLDRWPGANRTSKLVFITQGLAPDAVQARFDARSAASQQADPQADPLST